jgi:isoleucyl-tRNA synthetase
VKAIAILPTMQYSLVRCNRSNQLLIMASERIAALEETLRTTYATLASFAGEILYLILIFTADTNSVE